MDNVNLGLNQFCGPAVLSILTGLDTDTCAEAITEVNGKHKITGVNSHDLIKAGNNLGLEFEENEIFQGRSLFWTASVLVNFEGMYLITIPKHYIAIEVHNKQIQICDNHTKTPIDLQNSARLSQKIEKVWKVTKEREYVRPHLVKVEYHTSINGSRVNISKDHIFSDKTFKVYHLGSFECPLDKTKLQEIAFKLMELSEVK